VINIDWQQDYKQEFICPFCGKRQLILSGTKRGKRLFRCPDCPKKISESCNLKYKKEINDPNTNTIWIKGQKINHFLCPNCNDENIVFYYLYQGAKRFRCKTCLKVFSDSIYICKQNLSRYGHQELPIKAFIFDDDVWDTRTIIPSVDKQRSQYFLDFNNIKLQWFKSLIKSYIYHLCKLDFSFVTIQKRLVNLSLLSDYLAEKKLTSIEQVNRSVILDFLGRQANNSSIRVRLGTLRDFFYIGTIQGWFQLDQDIIKSCDYPKHKPKNPDPISDLVREQIESNLHKLPDFIARMWIISFFTAMRPSELALLKKDSLIQEGANWKIIWERKKTKDIHEVPVTRVIAKVVQEQQEYIHNLWGDDWDYLFCDYYGISQKDITQTKIKPVKKIIPKIRSPLETCIRCLIQAENIRDENGELGRFSSSLVRSTRLTQLFEQGHDLAIVSAWAGHKQLGTTSLYYTKVSCTLLEQELGHIQKALFNADGKPLYYESMPRSFWENLPAHQLELSGDHINTPIYGFCGLPLDERCDKFRACYTCSCFVASPEKLPQYIKVRSELKDKELRALTNGHDVLVEQFRRQVEQLDKIINSLESAT
jgi:integrase/transcription elongation factor Elf1